MVNNKKIKKVIEQAKQKGALKSYEEFCETNESKKYSLTKEEVEYYTKLKKGEEIKDEKI